MTEASDSAVVRGILERLIPGIHPLEDQVASACERNSLLIDRPRGTVLFDNGRPCTAFLLLDAGLVRVSRVGSDGREMLLYRVAPGETCLLTLSCLLSRADYPARGVVEEAIHGVLLPLEVFEMLSDRAPTFRKFIYHSFAERLAGLLDLASSVTFDRLDRRLAAALLARCGRTGRKELTVTHQDLAAELGTVRERVTRLLAGFEADGAVELGRSKLVVRDAEKLTAIAGA